jgi:hypothetical protein
MSELKDHWQIYIASGAVGFDVRMRVSMQRVSERQSRSTSPVEHFPASWQRKSGELE